MGGEANIGLAKALRQLRREHGWTLADVTARTGIAASTLSKVENGKLSLSYDKLVGLSHGLGVDITRLFARSHDAPGLTANTSSHRRSFEAAGDGEFVQTKGYNHRYLATDLLHKQLDPIVAELRARTMEEFGEWVRHPGEEFAYVLEGEVVLHTDVYAPLHMHPGDSVYFDSSMGHAYLAAGEGPSRVLSVTTSRIEDLSLGPATESPSGPAPEPPQARRAGRGAKKNAK